MSLSTTPVLTAVKEVLLGSTGATRTVPANTFQYGKHGGLTDTELAERAIVKPVFDVELLRAGRSPTTTGIFTTWGLYELSLRVTVAYHLSDEALDDAREIARALALDDADKILQALTYPGNVRQTSAGAATLLISGCLQSTSGIGIWREDLNNHLLITEMSFLGRMRVAQAA